MNNLIVYVFNHGLLSGLVFTCPFTTQPVQTVRHEYLACSVDVEERLIPDAEGLAGFINLSQLHFLEPWGDDLLLDAQQTSVKVTLTDGLTLKNTSHSHSSTDST